MKDHEYLNMMETHLIMEMIRGQTLTKWINKQYRDIHATKSICLQLLDALIYLH